MATRASNISFGSPGGMSFSYPGLPQAGGNTMPIPGMVAGAMIQGGTSLLSGILGGFARKQEEQRQMRMLREIIAMRRGFAEQDLRPQGEFVEQAPDPNLLASLYGYAGGALGQNIPVPQMGTQQQIPRQIRRKPMDDPYGERRMG